MITISEATADDFGIISEIAYKTWPSTYGNILSKVQLNYMLDLFYSVDGLNKNLRSGHHFLIAKEDGIALGFASYVHDYPKIHMTKIPKIYMLPEAQGKGIGKILIDGISAIAKINDSDVLTLNVNRSNKALGFYEKLGFEIVGEEDIELDHGYLMEDFIMEKRLPQP
ncbi:MAG TPA: GNAT family N-acetyltransferase [Flavobacterium sp.]|nr:GNAT family N-acetyltransferase [Flavobacterium sp.]